MLTAQPLDVVMRQNSMADRVFVLLQGPSSPFFAHLGQALRGKGADVVRIGFCPGDRLFWRKKAGRYRPYRGTIEEFPTWLERLLHSTGATDLIMLGNGRRAHEIASDVARSQRPKLAVWVVEHGYVRPNLILIEPEAMGGDSRIPEFFRNRGRDIQSPPAHGFPSSFLRYASLDIMYHAANLIAAPLFYPNHKPHSGIHPFKEYGGWVTKIFAAPKRAKTRRSTLERIERHGGPLFLFPLQLSHDTQLIKYGNGRAQEDTLDDVMESFAAHAPSDGLLVVKVHPLDNGLSPWEGQTRRSNARVCYLDGGDLDTLLGRLDGVVTINSTVGLSALAQGVPVLGLGHSVYKSAGLTAPQTLEEFWRNPETPDVERIESFLAFLRTQFHVPGSFDGPGASAGAQNLADWLKAPPNLAKTWLR